MMRRRWASTSSIFRRSSGRRNRPQRPQQSVACEPGDPGVPYAIGKGIGCPNSGGHKDVAPALGTLEDFDWLVDEIHNRGMEIALDFAINCSPDHPYVQDHPEWFYKRPDGTIKYAENPPKKYQDMYPLNFHYANWQELWKEMKSIIEFWADHGVQIFRVDNPHTKPVSFWEYLITGGAAEYPDAIFLSEAFTRPKMMKAFAKAGFTQSYTYFTWRNTKQELTDDFIELTQTNIARISARISVRTRRTFCQSTCKTAGAPHSRSAPYSPPRSRPSTVSIPASKFAKTGSRPGREKSGFEKISLERARLERVLATSKIGLRAQSMIRINSKNRALQFYDNLRFHPGRQRAPCFSTAR